MSKLQIGTLLRHKQELTATYLIADVNPFATPRVYLLAGKAKPQWLSQDDVHQYFEVVAYDVAAQLAMWEALGRELVAAFNIELDSADSEIQMYVRGWYYFDKEVGSEQWQLKYNALSRLLELTSTAQGE